MDIQDKIKQLKQQLEDTNDKLYSVGAMSISSEPRGAKNPYKTETLIDKKTSILHELTELEKQHQIQESYLMDKINNIDEETVRQIAMCRWLYGMTWNSTAEYLEMSYEAVKKRYDRYFKKKKGEKCN